MNEQARTEGANERDVVQQRLRGALWEKWRSEIRHERVADEEDAAGREVDEECISCLRAPHRVQDELGPSHRQRLATIHEAISGQLVAPPRLVSEELAEWH